MTETDILHNRNIHQIIICAIYGLCKAQNSNLPFNTIINSFIEIDPRSENLFRKLKIEETTGDIIKYYNEEYLKYMKSYLLAIARNCPKDLFTPFGVSNGSVLMSSNNDLNNAGSNNSYNKRRKMYEFGEPPEGLNSFNQMIARNNKHFLSFDEEKIGQPVKRHKIMDEILQGEDIVENLPEEFPGFKED